MALLELIDEKIVKIPLVSKTKPEVMREMVQILKDAGEIQDYDSVLQAVQSREEKQSTALQDGLVVLHGKSATVSSLKAAIGVSPEGIDCDSLDGNPSTLFFLLVASPGFSGPHVEALAEIAKLSQSKAFCRALVHSGSAKEFVALLKGE